MSTTINDGLGRESSAEIIRLYEEATRRLRRRTTPLPVLPGDWIADYVCTNWASDLQPPSPYAVWLWVKRKREEETR